MVNSRLNSEVIAAATPQVLAAVRHGARNARQLEPCLQAIFLALNFPSSP